MNWRRIVGVRAGGREILSVAALWAVLLAGSACALAALNWNAIRLINRIEYVEANRYDRTMVLYAEAEKRAASAFAGLKSSAEMRLAPNDPDYGAATDLYAQALALDPRGPLDSENARHYQILMRLHESAGSTTRTLAAMTRDALTRNDTVSAADYAARLAAAAPDSPEAWILTAEPAIRTGRLDDATSAAARVETASGKETSIVHELRARIAVARNDSAAAIEEYVALLRLKPGAVDARKALASLLLRGGRNEEALRTLTEGREQGGSSDGNYMHILGETLLAAGRAGEAADALTKAAELEPRSASVHWSLARAHLKAGNARRSDAAMQRAFALDPKLRAATLEN